jgi:hypothetical protein
MEGVQMTDDTTTDDTTTDDTTTDDTTTGYGLEAFISSGNSFVYLDEKTVLFGETGDFVTVGKFPSGVASVKISWSQHWKFHGYRDVFELSRVDYDKTYSGVKTIKPGESVEWRVKEQTFVDNITLPDGKTIGKDHQGTGFMNSRYYIDDVDIKLVLSEVKLADGSLGVIKSGGKSNEESYSWKVYDADGKLLTSDKTVGSRSKTKAAIAAYVKQNKLKRGSWEILDALGNIIESNTIKPPEGEAFPVWMIAVAVVAIIAVGLVIYAVTRRPAVAAAPAAAPPVTVVKT